jgi:hypothetical protein
VLKYIFHDDFRDQFFDIANLFKEIISGATGMESLETFLRYVISATDKINEQDIKELLTKKVPQGGDTIMPTIAEKWIQQGMQQGLEQGIQQGMQQGMQQGIKQGLLEAIQLGLELKFGAKGLSLYPDICKIEDSARLRSIKEAIVIAKEIQEIKGLIKD